MAHHQEQRFVDTHVDLDGHTFSRCIFDGCVLNCDSLDGGEPNFYFESITCYYCLFVGELWAPQLRNQSFARVEFGPAPPDRLTP